jgi:acetoin utilization deacetylase AcuC-like enzyme
MIWVAYDDCYAHGLPAGHRFPMLKYELIPEQLIYEGTLDPNWINAPQQAKAEDVLRCHDALYFNKLVALELSYHEIRRMGFPLSKELIKRELIIAQGSIDAAISSFTNGISFNVAGGTHHAGSNWAEGFCLLNDQAIAAAHLLANNFAKRIAIIDLDVHQGNGTAEIFSANDKVFTFSMHAEHNFPYRKEKSDLDIPLPDQCDGMHYLSLLSQNLAILKNKFDPDFIFYQAGVDVLASDKLGRLALSINECKERDILVFEFAKKQDIPVMVSMGGGYSADIKIIVEAHCNTFRSGFQYFEK